MNKSLNSFFSVIVPAFNAEKYIFNTIKSVINQKFPFFELIIVNDGSIDNTEKIVLSINDKRIKYYKIKNQGVAFARNFGLSKAQYEYVCFLDSDDVWFDDHLLVLNNIIEKNKNMKVWLTGYQAVDFCGNITRRTDHIIRINKEYIILENVFEYILKYGVFFHLNSFCIKKEIINTDIRFCDGEKIGEDDDFMYKVFALYPVVFTNTVTTEYIRNVNSVTSKKIFNFNWVFVNNAAKIINKYTVPEEKILSIKKIINLYYLSKVKNYLLLGEKKRAIINFVEIDRKNILKAKYIKTFLLILVPTFILKIGIKIRDRNYFIN